MTFADKYEILEAVGRGRVETFVARKVSTDQRVLVYVFEGREQRPEEPTVQWVLESFRALAPGPPELVVETGRYNATSYAYLVTKLPDPAALQGWLRSYEAQPEAKAESEGPPGNMPSANAVHRDEETSPGETSANDKSTRSPATTDQPEEITKVFEALRARLKPDIEATRVTAAEVTNGGASGAFSISSSEVDLAPPSANVKRAPGEFTMEFLSGFDHEKPPENHPVPTRDATPTQVLGLSTGQLFTYSADGKMLERRQGSVTEVDGVKPATSDNRLDTAELANLVGSSSTQPGTKPAHTTSEIAPARSNTGGTGEFTDFFQGPFDGEKPSATPELSLPVSKPEQTGDFTRIFGRMKEGGPPDAGATQTPNRDSQADAREGTFTKAFETPENPAKSSAVYQPEPEMRERVEAREPNFSGVTEWPSPITEPRVSGSAADKPVTAGSSTANLLRDAEPSFTPRNELEGATRVFSPPGTNPAPNFSSLPAGPSEYTRIISGRSKPPASHEPASGSGSQNGPSMNMSVPSVSMPPAAPVSMPGASPHIPSVPSVAPPPVPQLPQPGIAAPAPAAPTPWTLIIILNVLLILAVGLVLYFALKH